MSGASSVNEMAYCESSCAADAIRCVVLVSRIERDQNCQGYSLPPKAPRVLLVNTGTCSRAPEQETSGKPPSPVMSRHRGRVLVVVRARESRVHGEGGQSMSAAARPLG